MDQEEKQRRLESLDKSIQKLKDNQKLIMGCLLDMCNRLNGEDLKVVRWGYNQRFKMLLHEKHTLLNTK